MVNLAKQMALAVGAAVSFLLLIGVHGSAQAQTYPTRTIRIIVPVAPGGGFDFVARVIAEKLSQTFGHRVIVENRAGGSTNIATEFVARAAPDGYTLMIHSGTASANRTLFKDLRFDILKDFEYVCLTTSVPNILVVHPSVPAKSVKELIEYAKAHPGKLTFGSAGIGSSQHFSGELFKMMAGIDMLHVPYKGGGAAVPELLGGHVSMYFAAAPSVMPHVQSEKLRALGVTSAKRSPSVSSVPTIAESGLPNFELLTWHGIFAPAGTPQSIVTKLNAEIVRLLRMPDVEKILAPQGVDIIASTPAELADFIKEDVAKNEKIIKAANIHVEW